MPTRQQKQAEQRASVILQVRAAQITATQGAQLLQISRKTYYQWEKRGLEALMAAVEQQAPGRRPQRPSKETQKLQKRIGQLEAQLKTAEETARLRALIMATRSEPKLAGTKRKMPQQAVKKKPH